MLYDTTVCTKHLPLDAEVSAHRRQSGDFTHTHRNVFRRVWGFWRFWYFWEGGPLISVTLGSVAPHFDSFRK